MVLLLALLEVLLVQRNHSLAVLLTLKDLSVVHLQDPLVVRHLDLLEQKNLSLVLQLNQYLDTHKVLVVFLKVHLVRDLLDLRDLLQ